MDAPNFKHMQAFLGGDRLCNPEAVARAQPLLRELAVIEVDIETARYGRQERTLRAHIRQRIGSALETDTARSRAIAAELLTLLEGLPGGKAYPPVTPSE